MKIFNFAELISVLFNLNLKYCYFFLFKISLLHFYGFNFKFSTSQEANSHLILNRFLVLN